MCHPREGRHIAAQNDLPKIGPLEQILTSQADVPPRYSTALLAISVWSNGLLSGCAHPAERALQGSWHGESVENFDAETMAAATGWARGTTFEFDGTRLKVSLPARGTRTGVYQLSAIEDRTVTLNVLSSRGDESELKLIVDDANSMRWMLEDGRALVLKRDP